MHNTEPMNNQEYHQALKGQKELAMSKAQINTITITQEQLNRAVELFLIQEWGLKQPRVSEVRTSRPTDGERSAIITLTINSKGKTNEPVK